MSTDASRFDVALFGATGFTGELVAEYLAQRLAPDRHRWAIAGRDVDKLRAVRRKLAAIAPAWSDVAILQADCADPESLADLAARTRVLVSTVGPYVRFGEPVVRACVEQGADYLDITGEPTFWRHIVDAWHERAVEAGVMVVPCCGFDSVPADLGVWFAVKALAAKGKVDVDGYVAASARVSGGTWASLLGIMADIGLGDRPSWGVPRPRVHFSDEVQRWVAPLPVIDPLVVRRSAELLDGAYGESFRYRHYLQAKSLRQLVRVAAGAGVLFGLAKVPAVRRRLVALRPSGSGPDERQRARAWFRVHVHARGDDRSVRVRVQGGDPGYGETPRMVGEAAMCLLEARDRLPLSAGVLTPAAAFGDELVQRVCAAGLAIDRID